MASTCHHEHRCGSEAITSNETIVEICVMINEFNSYFHDNDSIYYYVMGELDSCGFELSYSYNCVNGDYIHSHLGIKVYCSYHSLGTDDYDNLI